MSDRHLFTSADGLVVKALRGLISYNPTLGLIEDSKVVYNTAYNVDQVSIISGGGSGHEPAFAGYVGENMLTASVSGEIFASPSTSQMLSALEAVPSKRGQIIVAINYTGDCLNFGLATEKANAMGKSQCGMLVCGDDVSVGRKGELVGRRGLAGQLCVLKIMGAASGSGESFEALMGLGSALCDQIVSIAATLDHCHVPGRTEHATLAKNEVELGTGPHNEPGFKKISPVPSAPEFISTILKYCLDESDTERAYVHFEAKDQIVLVHSNFGGISNLEQGAIVDETLTQLERDWKIVPVRIYSGPVLTSLNAPAFSTSLINLTAAAKNCNFSVEQMLQYLDVKTNTQWEMMAGSQAKRRPRQEQTVKAKAEQPREVDPSKDLKVDPQVLESMLTSACHAVVAAEQKLTQWDTVLGDGDCGETLKTGANALLASIESKKLAQSGSVIQVLYEIEKIVENRMGGTLGGILGIFFVSLTNNLQRNVQSKSGEKLWAAALSEAITSLQRYTPAKVGDRTIMDVLIPFTESLGKTDSFADAVNAAKEGAEKTRSMQPKLGRATYIGHEEGKELPPDPGAMGALEAIQGLHKALMQK